MDQPLIFTVIGADREGLVQELAEAVSDHGGNWIDSRMSRLAGQFAGVVRVDVAAQAAGALTAALQGLSSRGLTVVVSTSEDPPARSGRRCRLDIVGHDHPGIIRDITRAVARLGINVDSLSSEVRSVPMSGDNMFHADALLWVPSHVELEALQGNLEMLAADLMVEIAVER